MRGRGDDAPPPHLAGEGCQRVRTVGGGADAAPLDAARHGEAQEAHIDRVRQAQQGGPARSPTGGAPVVPPGGFAGVARGGRPWTQVERGGRSQNQMCALGEQINNGRNGGVFDVACCARLDVMAPCA